MVVIVALLGSLCLASVETSYVTTAARVYGQAGSFTTNTANNGGPSGETLNNPHDVVFDASGGLYIADGQCRVLFFPPGMSVATRVYGQHGSLSSVVCNNGGVSADSLSIPWGLALDPLGGLYVADAPNNRVLFYVPGNSTASRVYGQLGSFGSNTQNNGGVTANGLCSPKNLALDSSGSLYVTDFCNSRVLFFPAGSTTATRVYGQGNSFTSSVSNLGGVSATSLNAPAGVALDQGDGVYVADTFNNRVLYFPAGSTTSTRVYGQLGSFTQNVVNNGGVSASSFDHPYATRVDEVGGLFVAELDNNRVLYFVPNSTTASAVFGQLGSFITAVANIEGVTANTIYAAEGMSFGLQNELAVADVLNNRVLVFVRPSAPLSSGAIAGIAVAVLLVLAVVVVSVLVAVRRSRSSNGPVASSGQPSEHLYYKF